MNSVKKPGENPRRHPLPERLAFYAVLAVLSTAAGFLLARLISETGWLRELPQSAEQEVNAATGFGKLIRHTQPEAVPDLVFQSAGGKPHRLSEWRGKVVLLNLWATWCPPCKAEMPSLDRLQGRLGTGAFTVLAISTERAGPEKPADFFAGHGITHLAVYNDSTATAATGLRASGLPVSVILDQQGREVARLLGPADWDDPGITAKIVEFIDQRSPS